MKKKLIVKQNGLKECGSACILSVLRYYGGNAPLSKIVELTRTDKYGTNFYNMQVACKSLGLSATGYYLDSYKKLYNLSMPLIVQVVKENYEHFMVLYKITNSKVILMDPAKGMVIYKIDNFLKIFKGNILLLEPYKSLTNIKMNNKFNVQIYNIIIRNKNSIIKTFILSVVYSVLACIYSFYLGYMIENRLDCYNKLLIVTVVFLSIIIIKNIIGFLRNNILINLNKKIDFSLITYAYNFVLKLPYNYYRNKTTGEVISRINDLSSIKNLLVKAIVCLFFDLIIVLLGIIILYNICHKLFVIVLLITISYIILFLMFKGIIKRITINNQENNAKVNNLMVESITGFESIKAINVSDVFVNKMKSQYLTLLEGVSFRDKVLNVEMFIRDLIEGILLILIIYIGIKCINNGSLSLSNFVAFNTMFGLYLSPLSNIIDSSKDYFFVTSAIKRVNDLFEVDEEVLNDDYNELNLSGNIKINNLGFNHNYKNNILTNINTCIKEGDKVLIIGKSGSGKSTLIKLLYKCYDIPRGKIYIGDNDLCDYNLNVIRNNIGLITQNETVFTGSIKDNIILNRNINYEDFIKVCNLTCIDDIVLDKITGYDYMLEENAINISGGQRQRIILARILLKKSNIYLIDEGLNQLDVNLERKILKNIFKQYAHKTFIIISHRYENMDLYDKVIEMENGKIISDIDKI